jgi:hypothetical protein
VEVIVVAVAVCATAATALAGPAPVWGRVLAAAAAVGSAVLPLLRPGWSGIRLKDWTRARSVSEALKADVYMWLAGASPFTDDPAPAVLRERTDKLRQDAAGLVPQREGIEAERRDMPAVHDLPSYFAVRVPGEFEGYYRRKAGFIAGRLRLFGGSRERSRPARGGAGPGRCAARAVARGLDRGAGHGRDGAVGACGGQPVRVPAHRVFPHR